MSVSLQTLILKTRRLLHDSSPSPYFSDDTLTAFINEGLKQRDRDTSKNRVVVSSTLTTGQNFYTLASIHPQAFDVVSVIYMNGNLRTMLFPEAYSVAAYRYQPYPAYSQLPAVFARHGAIDVYIAPAPNQDYAVEWDVVITSPDLVNLTDEDVLPDIWSESVPYFAASLAKFQLQQSQKAEEFEQKYIKRTAQLLDTTFQVGNLAPPPQAYWRRR